MTMMDGTAKVYTLNYNNMYGKFKNQYYQWRVSRMQEILFLKTSSSITNNQATAGYSAVTMYNIR
jgi:hypothetical protein